MCDQVKNVEIIHILLMLIANIIWKYLLKFEESRHFAVFILQFVLLFIYLFIHLNFCGGGWGVWGWEWGYHSHSDLISRKLQFSWHLTHIQNRCPELCSFLGITHIITDLLQERLSDAVGTEQM